MRRWLRRLLAVLPFGLTAALLLWTLTFNPFAAPLVERSTAELAVHLERAMARTVTPDWLAPRYREAIAAQDVDRIEMLEGLARDHGVALDTADLAAARAIRDDQSGFWATTVNCGTCALDIGSCRSLAQIGACALPFEMSPLGDVNALGRAAADYWDGQQVDQLEVGLALAGLAATGAILVSGGSSATVKAGTGLVRMARRLGSLTPAFARVLGDAVRLPVNWGRVPAFLVGRAGVEEVTDAARLARLMAVASDLGRIRANTSATEALVLLRHVDSAEDAARLARVSDAAGPRTRAVMDTLGKGRVFRALVRLGDLAIAAAALAYAVALQVLVLVAERTGRSGLRLLRLAMK